MANRYTHTGLCQRKFVVSLSEATADLKMEADEKMVLAGILHWDREERTGDLYAKEVYACNF